MPEAIKTLGFYGIPACVVRLVPDSVHARVVDAVASVDGAREAGTKRRASFQKETISLGGSSKAKVARGIDAEFCAWGWAVANLQAEIGTFDVTLPSRFADWFARLEQREAAKAA